MTTETRNLKIKWSGKEYELENVSLLLSVLDLKNLIYEKTNVRPERQKLLTLKLKGLYCIVLFPYILPFQSITSGLKQMAKI